MLLDVSICVRKDEFCLNVCQSLLELFPNDETTRQNYTITNLLCGAVFFMRVPIEGHDDDLENKIMNTYFGE